MTRTYPAKRNDARNRIIAQLADNFEASDKMYTCAAIVIDHVAPLAERLCAAEAITGRTLRPRVMALRAADEIHRRWREQGNGGRVTDAQ